MNRYQAKQQSSEIKLTKIAHAIMLILCFLSSIFLYFTDSVYYRIIISSIMVFYTIFLVMNPKIIELIIGMLISIDSQNVKTKTFIYDDWQMSKYKNQRQNTKINDKQNLNYGLKRQKNKLDIIKIIENNPNIYRNCSFNQKKRIQNKGLDLQNIIRSEIIIQSTKSLKKENNGIVILDKNTKNLQFIQAKSLQNIISYELQLKYSLKINESQVKYKYKAILKIINKLVNRKLNWFGSLKQDIKKIYYQHFNITFIADNSCRQNSSHNLTYLNRSYYAKVSYWELLQELLMIHTDQKTAKNIQFKSGKIQRPNQLQKNIFLLVKQLQKYVSSILIKSSSLIKYANSDVGQFIRLLRRNINMLQQFKKQNLQIYQNGYEEFAQKNIRKSFNNKIFILFLFIHDINHHIDTPKKISIVDYWNYGSIKYQHNLCQVDAKNSFDFSIPHLNVTSCQATEDKCYSCQPGSNNYLSVILMIVHLLAKQKQILRRNPYISALIHQIV